MDVIVIGAGFSGSLAATRLSFQGFIDRKALHNVIVPMDAISNRSASFFSAAQARSAGIPQGSVRIYFTLHSLIIVI